MATMLLGGLWHGAGWTFIIWGGLHGLYLMINHGWRELKAHLGWREGGILMKLFAGALTFLAVVVAWVFFRADSFTSAWSMLAGMSGLNGVSSLGSLEDRFAPLLGKIVLLDLIFNDFLHISHPGTWAVLSAIVVSLASIWLLPNVRQMLVNQKPTWDDMVAKTTLPSQPGNKLTAVFAWRPTKMIAILLGVVFAFSILGMTRSSEFLYYQF
jgi:hypothetical protein